MSNEDSAGVRWEPPLYQPDVTAAREGLPLLIMRDGDYEVATYDEVSEALLQRCDALESEVTALREERDELVNTPWEARWRVAKARAEAAERERDEARKLIEELRTDGKEWGQLSEKWRLKYEDAERECDEYKQRLDATANAYRLLLGDMAEAERELAVLQMVLRERVDYIHGFEEEAAKELAVLRPYKALADEKAQPVFVGWHEPVYNHVEVYVECPHCHRRQVIGNEYPKNPQEFIAAFEHVPTCWLVRHDALATTAAEPAGEEGSS